MLALLDARLLTREQILVAVDTAIRTKRQAVVDSDDPVVMDQAAAILGLIANSFEAAAEGGMPAVGR